MAALSRRARPSRAEIWARAARPRTLPAALVPVAVGSAWAAHQQGFHAPAAGAAALTALALQVAANFANDVYDFERGADHAGRLGPARATQQGWVTPRAMRRAMGIAFAVAALAGATLVWRGGWPLAAAGALAMAAGYAYTGGPWPLGYRGLGDLLVFVFFGLVGVAGSAYVQTLELSAGALLLGVPIGLLATVILAVNNLRDLETDRAAGKRTLAVRLGEGRTRLYIAALLALAHATLGLGAAVGWLPAGALLAWVSLPASVALARAVWSRRGSALNPCLGAAALHEALFGALLAMGLLA